MRTPASRRSSLARLLACGLVAVSATGTATAAELYGTSLNAATGGNPAPSSLYSIDSTTGAGTLIGSVGHAINGLAFDPTTGVLYGSTPPWDASAPGRLLVIDLATGAGTPVGGPFGVPFVSNLTFNDAGELYAFAHHGDELVRIDKLTGLATVFRDESVGAGANLLAFDNDDVLMLLIDEDLWAVDTTTATITLAHDLTVDPGHHGGFDPDTGLLWSVFTLGFVQDSVISYTNVVTDEITLLDTDVQYLHTLAFHEGGGPGLCDLHAQGRDGRRLQRRFRHAHARRSCPARWPGGHDHGHAGSGKPAGTRPHCRRRPDQEIHREDHGRGRIRNRARCRRRSAARPSRVT